MGLFSTWLAAQIQRLGQKLEITFDAHHVEEEVLGLP